MFILQPTGGPGIGMRVMTHTVPVTARAAFLAGDIVMFDLANSDGDVSDNLDDGGDDSGWANVINPATTQEQGGFFGITPGIIADNDEFDVIVAAQRVSALIHTTGGGSAAAYDELIIDVSVEANALTYDAPGVVGVTHKILGTSLGVVTTPTTPTAGFVAFDGINGFGSVFLQT